MIRKLLNVDEKIVVNYLKKHELETVLLYGNVIEYGLENLGKRRHGNYYGYFMEEELRGVIAFYNMGSLIFHYEDIRAIDEFKSLALEEEFKTIIGPKHIVDKLVDEIKYEKKITDYIESKYFINKNFQEYCLTGETLSINELSDEAVDFLVESRELGFDEDIDMEEAFENIKYRDKDEYIIFIRNSEKIVATANLRRSAENLSQIGGIYVDENFREKGYGKKVVSELCKLIIREGKVPCVAVENNNIAAIKVYEDLGFEKCGNYLTVEF